MEGLEHKDQRLHAAQDVDWRDKLAKIGRDLPDDDPDDDDPAASADAGPAPRR